MFLIAKQNGEQGIERTLFNSAVDVLLDNLGVLKLSF